MPMRRLEPAATMMAAQWWWLADESMMGGDCLQTTGRVGKRIHEEEQAGRGGSAFPQQIDAFIARWKNQAGTSVGPLSASCWNSAKSWASKNPRHPLDVSSRRKKGGKNPATTCLAPLAYRLEGCVSDFLMRYSRERYPGEC